MTPLNDGNPVVDGYRQAVRHADVSILESATTLAERRNFEDELSGE